jgi:hypothetical protein
LKINANSVSTRILVTCCAFSIGLAATMMWLYHGYTNDHWSKSSSRDTAWCSVEEDCILEAIYRYEIQHSEGAKPTSLFFLSREQKLDPSIEVIKRLESDSYQVKGVSQSIEQEGAFKDETGKKGVVLKVSEIRWTGENTVEANVSARFGNYGGLKGYVYYLLRSDNGWMIKERKFAYES